MIRLISQIDKVNILDFLKVTVKVTLSDPPWNDVNAKYKTVPLKVWNVNYISMFLRLKTDYFQVWAIEKVTYTFPLQEKNRNYQKWNLSCYILDKGFKGFVLNQGLPTLNGKFLVITRVGPLYEQIKNYAHV